MNELANERSNDEGLRELALFAGAGGGILAGKMLGLRTVCAVEWEAYPASVLAARQNDGHLEPFPIWDDVRTFDGSRWRGRVDVVSGGFPCQDISAAGKGAGIDGERSGMWVEMARIIGEVRPRFVFVENSPMLCSRGLGRVLGDLATMGFDAEWGVLGANAVGAPHRRDRIWIVGRNVADAKGERTRHVSENNGQGCLEINSPDNAGGASGGNDRHKNGETLAHARLEHEQGQQPSEPDPQKRRGQIKRQARPCGDGDRWWSFEPDVGRVVNGVASRVDRLKAIGNGQVPQCAAAAFIEGYRRLME